MTAQTRTTRHGRASYMLLRDRRLLRTHRLAQHYTIREAAALAGCSPSFIGHLESGHKRSCTPELAVQIEKALRVSPGALFVPRVSNVKLAA